MSIIMETGSIFVIMMMGTALKSSEHDDSNWIDNQWIILQISHQFFNEPYSYLFFCQYLRFFYMNAIDCLRGRLYGYETWWVLWLSFIFFRFCDLTRKQPNRHTPTMQQLQSIVLILDWKKAREYTRETMGKDWEKLGIVETERENNKLGNNHLCMNWVLMLFIMLYLKIKIKIHVYIT